MAAVDRQSSFMRCLLIRVAVRDVLVNRLLRKGRTCGLLFEWASLEQQVHIVQRRVRSVAHDLQCVAMFSHAWVHDEELQNHSIGFNHIVKAHEKLL